MTRRFLLTLATILCGYVTGCTTVKTMHDITQVSVTSDAGSILPELQWHEEITITQDGGRLVRHGRTADTAIHEGSWAFPVDASRVAALFAQLEAVDCSTIERIEPDDPPDGGHTESYTIIYGRDKTFHLGYDPGVTYTDGALLVEPIEAFIKTLELPVDAVSRYK
jgi:hypothetical protein